MKSRVKKIFFTLFIVVLSLCLLPISALAAQPADTNKQIIKVFLPLQDGFASVDDEGNYGGYNYEYLMRVGQLTGWQYEFVTTTATNSDLLSGLEKVKQGELHLVGTMIYSEELSEEYEYSSSYGDVSYVLVTKTDNTKLNSRTLDDYPNLKVAMIKSAEVQNTLFEEFCRRNGIEFTPVYGADNFDCLNLVDSGLADAVISKDVSHNTGLKIIAKFSPEAFHFAATKGEVELIEQLNSALLSIEVSDTGYRERMHAKYFSTDITPDLPLTEDEREYLASAPVVRVAVLDGGEPIQFYDKVKGEFSGILPDLLDVISERSGLSFELLNAGRGDTLEQSLVDGSIDVVLGVPHIYRDNMVTGELSGILLTPPIFSSPIVRISSLKAAGANCEIIVSRSIKMFEGKEDMIYCDDVQDIFGLINRGEYGEAYVNGYMAQHAIEDGNYPNVALSFTSYGEYELCLGVSRANDLRLINILTQAIATISDSEVEEIVYRNTNHEVDDSIWKMLKRNPVQVVIPVLAVLIIILGLLSLLVAKTKHLNKIISKEKNEYKEISQLDRLSKTYNNAAFKHLAMKYLSKPDDEVFGAIIVCDIDDFKSINDTLGHLKGDEVIEALGGMMTSIFRSEDIVGRLGGDEFVVLFKNISSKEIIEKRCAELCENSRSIIPEKEVTLSIGVAVFSGATDFDELFKLADSALYDVKNSGKNAYKICGDNIDPAFVEA